MRGSEIRICDDCGRPLSIRSFAMSGKHRRKTCRKCNNIRCRYKITGAQFYKMLEAQMHSCLICEEPINELTARIDHCHSDHEVRSLLCNSCNSAIGFLKHDKEVAARAIEYLVKYT